MKGLYRVLNFNRYAVYIIIIAMMMLPLLKPLGIPIKIGKESQKFHEVVGSGQPGDVMLLDMHFSLAAAIECMPQALATATHAYEQGIDIVLVTMNPEGDPFANNILTELDKMGAVYGEDIVYLGFIPGDELAIVSLLGDLHKTVSTDYEGTPLSSLPLTSRVKGGNDFKFAAPVTSDASGPEYWTRQAQPYANLNLLMISQASLWPKVQPYLATGQIKAALNGSRGAAEYEILLDRKGQAVASMDATSTAYLTFIGFVIVGNIVHWLEPKVKAVDKKEASK